MQLHVVVNMYVPREKDENEYYTHMIFQSVLEFKCSDGGLDVGDIALTRECFCVYLISPTMDGKKNKYISNWFFTNFNPSEMSTREINEFFRYEHTEVKADSVLIFAKELGMGNPRCRLISSRPIH
jgi:hypothetical protein